jgi:AcrR family transcriptional regulator
MSSSQRRRNAAAGPRTTKAERKRQILAHAKQLFLDIGQRATTLDKVAAAAGITEAVLRRHFASPAALFAAVVAEVRAATLDRWPEEIAAQADPLAKLHSVTELYLAAARSAAVELRIFHRALVESDDPEVLEHLRAFYLDAEALLAAVIAEGQQSGVFRRLDPRIGAWELIRAALGYTLTLPLDVPLYSEPDYLPHAIDCMLHCLLKTDV